MTQKSFLSTKDQFGTANKNKIVYCESLSHMFKFKRTTKHHKIIKSIKMAQNNKIPTKIFYFAFFQTIMPSLLTMLSIF